jgi:hypothetical protein
MSELSFDVLWRQDAAVVSRRRSLLAMGGTAAAAAALANSANSNARKKKRDPNTRCKQQARRCKASWENVCDDLNCEPAERAGLLGCCGLLKTCDIAEYNVCVLANVLG